MDLDTGTYDLYWRTRSHPPEEASFDDFEFVALGRPAVRIEDVSVAVFSLGGDGSSVVMSIGRLHVDSAGVHRFSIRVVGELPPGVPVVDAG